LHTPSPSPPPPATASTCDPLQVAVTDFLIEGRAVASGSSLFAGTIVDSGTTFTYLPPSAYTQARDQWRTRCPWGTCSSRTTKGQYPDDYCYTMSRKELDGFVSYGFKFLAGGHVLPLPPSQYGYEMRTGVWCLGIYNNEHNGAVIGAATMRNHEVVFDKGSARVAFVPSDCVAMHGGKKGSVLEGGYGLSGCAVPETPNPPPAPPAHPPPPPAPPPSPRPPPPPSPPPAPPPPPSPNPSPPRPPAHPPPPTPPSHPPGWHESLPPPPSPPYVGPLGRAWDGMKHFVTSTFDAVRTPIMSFVKDASEHRLSAERVFVLAFVAILSTACCALCCICWCMSDADDSSKRAAAEGGVGGGGLLSDRESEMLSMLDREILASRDVLDAKHNARRNAVAKVGAKGGLSPPGKSRVRWLPLRRITPSGYMRAGTHDEDGEGVNFEIGGDSDEEEDAPALGAVLGTAPIGMAPCGNAVASSALSVYADVPEGTGTRLRLTIASSGGDGSGGGAEINVPLPAGVVAHQAIRFQLLPSQIAALHAEDVLALREGRFHVSRVS